MQNNNNNDYSYSESVDVDGNTENNYNIKPENNYTEQSTQQVNKPSIKDKIKDKIKAKFEQYKEERKAYKETYKEEKEKALIKQREDKLNQIKTKAREDIKKKYNSPKKSTSGSGFMKSMSGFASSFSGGNDGSNNPFQQPIQRKGRRQQKDPMMFREDNISPFRTFGGNSSFRSGRSAFSPFGAVKRRQQKDPMMFREDNISPFRTFGGNSSFRSGRRAFSPFGAVKSSKRGTKNTPFGMINPFDMTNQPRRYVKVKRKRSKKRNRRY